MQDYRLIYDVVFTTAIQRNLGIQDLYPKRAIIWYMNIRVCTRVPTNTEPMFDTLRIKMTPSSLKIRRARAFCVDMERVLSWRKPFQLCVHQDTTGYSVKFYDTMILSTATLDCRLYFGVPPRKRVSGY